MDKNQKSKILSLIDRGTWKHSWHLEHSKFGYTDWSNKKNIEKCLEIAREAREEALALSMLGREVESILRSELHDIEQQEKIDAMPEEDNIVTSGD